MKVLIAVFAESGLVQTGVAKATHKLDVTHAQALLHGQKKSVFTAK
jgi:hypothetical protein